LKKSDNIYFMLLFLCTVALSGVACSVYKLKIIPTPSECDVTLNGKIIGQGVTSIELPDEYDAYEVGIIPPDGYFPKLAIVQNDADRVLTIYAEEDHSYQDTVDAAGTVNRWIVITVGDTVDIDDAWKRISKSFAPEISDFDIVDNKSLYLKTAWKIAGKEGDYLRTRSRIVVALENPDLDNLTFKLMIESVRIDAQNIEQRKIDRTFKPFLDILAKIKTRLNY